MLFWPSVLIVLITLCRVSFLAVILAVTVHSNWLPTRQFTDYIGMYIIQLWICLYCNFVRGFSVSVTNKSLPVGEECNPCVLWPYWSPNRSPLLASRKCSLLRYLSNTLGAIHQQRVLSSLLPSTDQSAYRLWWWFYLFYILREMSLSSSFLSSASGWMEHS